VNVNCPDEVLFTVASWVLLLAYYKAIDSLNRMFILNRKKKDVFFIRNLKGGTGISVVI